MKYIFTLILASILFSFSSNSQVVINEVYGGGGNSGSTYKNDFIELYNNGSTAVSLTGWSIQYASATGSTWNVTSLSGTIPANGYYLIQQAAGTAGTVNLPTPDATGNAAMAAGAGKVALVNTTTALTGTCPTGAQIIDFVGFGTTANCFEGAGPTPAPSASLSVQRTPIGTDTNNNSADFTTGAPSPMNSGGGADVTPPTIASLFPADDATGVNTSFTAVITFSEPITKGTSGTITLRKTSDNSVVRTIDITSSDVTVSGSTATFQVNSLDFNTDYYFEISAGAFRDAANNNFAGISGPGAWNFTTSAAPPAGTLGTTYSFNNCVNNIPDGFTQYSVIGSITWACTTFGRDPAGTNTSSAPYGVQINGFAGGTNVPNEDWLISPAFDLTGTTYPLLSFWSRTAFNGQPLQLKISTDYSGTGNPNNATWTDLNGKFPGQTSDVWTLSENINLSAFKAPKVFIAFVYTSSDEEGARWTLDDFRIDNSSTPPPPSITVSTTDIQYTYVASGSTASKTFTFTGNDITGDVTITTTGNFLVSKDGGTYSNTITYTQAEANNISKTVYVQFAPTEPNKNYNGSLTISTSGQTATVTLKGTSIDPAMTLEVVNWNIEWFGSAANGPTNDAQQEQNVLTILRNINADIYGLTEIVSEARLASVVSQMPGYAYVLSNYGSHTNTSANPPSALAEAQKLAFVYKTSVFSNVSATALLTQGINSPEDLTNPAYNYFASGRFPYMMTADVTLNGVTKAVRFVLIHGKANTSPTATSYERRKKGSDTLHYTLNNLYPNDNIIIFGDFNDDLDQTITSGINPPVTSYSAFTNDNTTFFEPTLALSNAGKKSTVSYNDVIDHVVISNEMQPFILSSSTAILTDVTTLVSNYASTTSDHYPVFTRYAFDATILPVKLLYFSAEKVNSSSKLSWATAQEISSKEFIVERSHDGITYQQIGIVSAAGNSSSPINYLYVDNAPSKGDNYYRLRIKDLNDKLELSRVVKLNFSSTFTFKIAPNPARGEFTVNISSVSTPMLLQILNSNGQIVKSQVINNGNSKVYIEGLSKGLYFVQLKNGNAVYVEKLMIE